jgi:hypothetical protein
MRLESPRTILALRKRRPHLHELDHSRLHLLEKLEPGVAGPVETLVDQASQVADLHAALDVHLADAVEGLFGGVKALEKGDESVELLDVSIIELKAKRSLKVVWMGLNEGVDALVLDISDEPRQ